MAFGVVFGGPSPEHDVSILTGLQSAAELSKAGHDVIRLYWSKAGDWYRLSGEPEGKDFLEGIPRSAEPIRLTAGAGFVVEKKGPFSKGSTLEFDAVVVCCHGGPGEDGSLQGTLDLAGINYTGPTVAGAALGMDKFAFGAVVAGVGLPTLPRQLLTESTESLSFIGPYILKPRFGGSSIGIEVVDNLETAKALLRSSPFLRAGAVIEPYKPASIDLNIAVRTAPELQLSAIEKPTRSATSSTGGILGYADKYTGGEGMASAPRELPAQIPENLTAEIKAMAAKVAETVGVRGVQRIDFLLDGDDLYVNEINTIPGSLSKHLFVEPKVAFITLLTDMIHEAKSKTSRHWTASGADGSALRSAGSIAGKLS